MPSDYFERNLMMKKIAFNPEIAHDALEVSKIMDFLDLKNYQQEVRKIIRAKKGYERCAHHRLSKGRWSITIISSLEKQWVDGNENRKSRPKKLENTGFMGSGVDNRPGTPLYTIVIRSRGVDYIKTST